MKDQAIILAAIAEVRLELKKANERGDSSIAIQEIMVRLSSLYACLNVEVLILITTYREAA
jgi:hypothetical protein